MKFLLAILFTCASLVSVAQVNFVRNPDFESYNICPPDVFNTVSYASYWSSLDTNNTFTKGYGFPEYCNSCIPKSSSTEFGVPFGRYYQFPHSGNGMMHGYYFCDETPPPPAPDYGYRDYLQGRLYKPLTAGKSYCVSFYLNLAERTTYATNKMGAYLDDGSIDTVSICSKPITHVRPQMFTNEVIADTMNWVKIEGSFTANGTERFITLGNFFSLDSIIYTIPYVTAHQWAYYLIDDVSVVATDTKANAGVDRWVEQTKTTQIGPVEDSTARGMDCKWYKKGVLIDSGNVITVNASTIKYAVDTYVVVQNVCGNITRDTMLLRTVGLGIKAPLSLGEGQGVRFRVSPNPNNGSFVITCPHAVIPTQEGTIHATVYDVLGRVVYQNKLSFTKTETTINLNTPSGTYLLEITDEAGNVQRGRLVIQ